MRPKELAASEGRKTRLNDKLPRTIVPKCKKCGAPFHTLTLKQLAQWLARGGKHPTTVREIEEALMEESQRVYNIQQFGYADYKPPNNRDDTPAGGRYGMDSH